MGSVIPYLHAEPRVVEANLFALSDDQFLEEMLELRGRFAELPVCTLAAIARRASKICAERPRTSHRARKQRPTDLFVVYWLFDSRDPDTPLYVGLTSDLRQRWRTHRNGLGCPLTEEQSKHLAIRVVQTVVGTLKDGQNAERTHIESARLINRRLLNRGNR